MADHDHLPVFTVSEDQLLPGELAEVLSGMQPSDIQLQLETAIRKALEKLSLPESYRTTGMIDGN